MPSRAACKPAGNLTIAPKNAERLLAAHAAGWLGSQEAPGLESNIQQGWVSCPMTQNGCIRILSQPRYPKPISVVKAA